MNLRLHSIAHNPKRSSFHYTENILIMFQWIAYDSQVHYMRMMSANRL